MVTLSHLGSRRRGAAEDAGEEEDIVVETTVTVVIVAELVAIGTTGRANLPAVHRPTRNPSLAVLAHEGTHPILYGSWPIPIGAGHRTGYIARPDGAGRFPVVLVLPSLGGLTSFPKDVCRRLARQGLAAIGVNFYREQHDDPLDSYSSLTDSRALTDLDEIHEFVISDDVDWTVSGDVGVLGIDVGGRFGLVATATRPWVKSLALCYTPLTGDDERSHQVADYLGSLPVPVLGLYGMDDELIDGTTVDEAQRRNDHGQWLLYEGAGHGFLDIDDDRYQPAAAEDAMARIVAFFRATLPEAIEEDLG